MPAAGRHYRRAQESYGRVAEGTRTPGLRSHNQQDGASEDDAALGVTASINGGLQSGALLDGSRVEPQLAEVIEFLRMRGARLATNRIVESDSDAKAWLLDQLARSIQHVTT